MAEDSERLKFNFPIKKGIFKHYFYCKINFLLHEKSLFLFLPKGFFTLQLLECAIAHCSLFIPQPQFYLLEKITPFDDNYFMRQALLEAQKAYETREIPIGAVVVCQNRVIARAHNQTELLNDVTAHAEMLAITAAANHLGSKYLQDCTLYVTVEPCIMCAGALAWAQFSRIVYGANEDKTGFMRYGKELLHPKTKVEFGIRHEECVGLMQSFFKEKRRGKQ